jgi:hypothetical protein
MSKVDSRLARPRAANRTAVFVPCILHDIETVYGLIEAFGGMDAFAEELDVSPDSVRDWAIHGYIPNGWHLRLFAKVCALDKTIAPSVFGFRDDDPAGRALASLMRDARLHREGGEHA